MTLYTPNVFKGLVSLHHFMEAHRVGSHSNILENVCAMQEQNVVTVRREGGAQGGVERRVGGNREGTGRTNSDIDLHNAQSFLQSAHHVMRVH